MASDIDLWKRVVASEKAFVRARMELVKDQRALVDKSENLLNVIRGGIQEPTERSAALAVARLLPIADLQQLFPSLISLASYGHGLTGVAKELILSLPRNWVLANIESVAEPILDQGGYEEYQRFLELYLELDRGLARTLAHRAAQNADKDIAEAGKGFLETWRKKDFD